MLQPLTILSPSLLREVNTQVRKANLPKRLLWPEGVIVTDLYREWDPKDQGVKRPLSLKGNFRVQHPAVTMVVENGATATHVNLFWVNQIDHENGRVVAIPALACKLRLDSYEMLRASGKLSEDTGELQTELTSLLGIAPREICSVGRLLPLFPHHLSDILKQFGIANTWDIVPRVKLARQKIAHTVSNVFYL